MPLGWQQKPWGGEKMVNKLEGDHVVHLQCWTTKPSKANSEAKLLKTRGMRETKLRMWMPFINERKNHKGKAIEEAFKARKWAKVKKGSISGSPWHVPIDKRIIDYSPLAKWWLKNKGGLLGVKRIDKKEEQKQLASRHMKFLEDGLMQDAIQCVYHIHCNTI